MISFGATNHAKNLFPNVSLVSGRSPADGHGRNAPLLWLGISVQVTRLSTNICIVQRHVEAKKGQFNNDGVIFL